MTAKSKVIIAIALSALIGLVYVIVANALAHGVSNEPSNITGVQSFTTAATEGNVPVFLQIAAKQQDKLVGASSDVSESVELHRVTKEGKMVEVDSLKVAQGTTTFSGTEHLMLVDIDQELAYGGEVEVTLDFETSKDAIVTVPVFAKDGHNHEH